MIENLGILDNLVIAIYFAVVLGIGIYVKKFKDQNTTDYFLAGRNIGWIAIGISLFATNISSEHLVGLAGAGSTKGLVAGHFEWIAVIIIVLLGWVFAPIFIRSRVFTMPQFIGKRFDYRSRIYLTGISIIAYLTTKILIMLCAGGLLLHEVLGWDMFTSTLIMVLFTGIYTIIGGLSSVISTQIFQTIVLILGATLLTIFGINEIGGIGELTKKLPNEFFKVFKPFTDPEFPWTGIIFGAPILAIWYWCTDQYIVQRILSSKGIGEAKKGTLLAASLKVLPVFILLIPGLIALILFPEIKGDEAYPRLISGSLLPVGIKGIVICGLFAALMSSLASAFNSTATLITIDIYKPIFKNASDRELVLIGRLATTVIVLATLFMVPLVKHIDSQIYIYLQTVQAYISPPIVSVFLFGIFWKKASSRGAIMALSIGGFLGILRIIFELMDKSVTSAYPLINYYCQINYLHFAIYLFILSSVILVALSYVTAKERDEAAISNYMFQSRKFNRIESAIDISKL